MRECHKPPLSRARTRGVQVCASAVTSHTPPMCPTPICLVDGRVLWPAAAHRFILVRSAYVSSHGPCKSGRGVVASLVSPLDLHIYILPVCVTLNHTQKSPIAGVEQYTTYFKYRHHKYSGTVVPATISGNCMQQLLKLSYILSSVN